MFFLGGGLSAISLIDMVATTDVFFCFQISIYVDFWDRIVKRLTVVERGRRSFVEPAEQSTISPSHHNLVGTSVVGINSS